MNDKYITLPDDGSDNKINLRLDSAPDSAQILITHEGVIKYLNFSSSITDPIQGLSNAIGEKKDETPKDKDIYTLINDNTTLINEINEKIGSPKIGTSDASGIYKRFEDLEADIEILKDTPTFKGYQLEFINTEDERINLLKENAEFSYDLSKIKNNIANMNTTILNNQQYLFEIYLGLIYTPKEKITDTISGQELNYTVTFDLNSIYHSSNKNSIIQLPFTNTILIFKFNFSGNTIKFSIKGTKDTDKIKDNEIFINHGVFKAHMLGSI